jgi:hypothetical protein
MCAMRACACLLGRGQDLDQVRGLAVGSHLPVVTPGLVVGGTGRPHGPWTPSGSCWVPPRPCIQEQRATGSRQFPVPSPQQNR